jgi:hypothetical protein
MFLRNVRRLNNMTVNFRRLYALYANNLTASKGKLSAQSLRNYLGNNGSVERSFGIACAGYWGFVGTNCILWDAKTQMRTIHRYVIKWSNTPRVVFICLLIIVKVTCAPGDQGPTQPNLSNVGYYSPTRLSTDNKQLPSLMRNSALTDLIRTVIIKIMAS